MSRARRKARSNVILILTYGDYYGLDEGRDRCLGIQANPLKALKNAVDGQIAVLSQNRPIGYFVGPDVFTRLPLRAPAIAAA